MRDGDWLAVGVGGVVVGELRACDGLGGGEEGRKIRRKKDLPIEIPIVVPEQRPRRAEQNPLFGVRVRERCGRAVVFENVRFCGRVFGGDFLGGLGEGHRVDGVDVERQRLAAAGDVGVCEHGAEEGEAAWCGEVGFVGDIGGLR